jgi:hypothetical protein
MAAAVQCVLTKYGQLSLVCWGDLVKGPCHQAAWRLAQLLQKELLDSVL